MTNKIQIRGNCQCCGADQAVKSGRMSKHGYTVAEGWFNGVCDGQHYAPLQTDRTHTDLIVKSVLAQVVELESHLNGLKNGSIKPEFITKTVKKNGRWEQDFSPFADADKFAQNHEVAKNIRTVENRIRAGNDYAKTMNLLADQFYGTALREVEKAAAPAPILIGEVRIAWDHPVKATRVDGARVYWAAVDSVRKGWIGTGAWRKLAIVA